jgi:RNA polymerase sigma-70 factor (family 1)
MVMTEYQILSDQELIALLQEEDGKALRALYDRYIRQLHYFILRIAKSKVLTEDVLHDVFLKIWDNRMQIDPEQPFKSYLFTIAKRHLLNLLKRAQHEGAILEQIQKNTSPVESATDMDVDYRESRELISEAINQLPAQCREVFVRCKVQGLSYKETADELGITEGTVNSQMVKALKSIRQFITIRNAVGILFIYLLN